MAISETIVREVSTGNLVLDIPVFLYNTVYRPRFVQR